VIAFLPFPTAMIGRDLNTVSGPLYIGTMLVLSYADKHFDRLLANAGQPALDRQLADAAVPEEPPDA